MRFIVLVLFVISVNFSECVNLNDLFSRMTAQDKCGQMTQVDTGLVRRPTEEVPTEFTDDLIDADKMLYALNEKRVGSILGMPYTGTKGKDMIKFIRVLHEFALNSTRLKIPVLFGMDFVHGVGLLDEAVNFPHQMALGSSFNTHISHRIGEITGMESRAIGVPWNFSPILDIGRQPLWPRYNKILFGDEFFIW